MKQYFIKFIRYIFPILAMGLLIFLAPSRMTQAATAVPTLRDEFSGTNLDPAKWTVVHGDPSLVKGKLVLAGGIHELAEVQSLQPFRFAVLQMSIDSLDWKAQNDPSSDSSFGFEIWDGANGQCHYSVVLKANGHLGAMRSHPDDVAGNCSGDPAFQAHEPIQNWDAVRAQQSLRITLTWALKSVTLHVTTGSSTDGGTYYFGTAEPTNWLKIRLNADKGEKYRVDYVRVVGISWP